jgi:hypothetical protein
MSLGSDCQILAERYDELRREVLKEALPCARGQGLTLFLTQGMADWVRAWLCFAPAQKRPNSEVAASEGPPSEHKQELVRILSAMLIKNFQGREEHAF